ncbi:MAG: phospholipase D family protein [Pseudomonadota bacterium]|nr:phospholipase D family protein [Pseudomonadota bacterium]
MPISPPDPGTGTSTRRVARAFLTPLLVLSTLALPACANLPDRAERRPELAFPDTASSSLGKAIAPELDAHPNLSGFYPLPDGEEAFLARVLLADLAQRSLDVQYYLFHTDSAGTALVHHLLEAAERGVRVRLLLDDMGTSGKDRQIAALNTHPDIEVRIFNPFARNTMRLSQFLSRYGRVTRRMHNKSFIADNQFAILGGRNIGNEYFGTDEDTAFSDLDIVVAGPAVQDASDAFDLYWNSELAYRIDDLKQFDFSTAEITAGLQRLDRHRLTPENPPYSSFLEDSRLARILIGEKGKLYWGNARVIYDHPDKLHDDPGNKENHLVPQLKSHIGGVGHELIIFSPYFVPGRVGAELLSRLSMSGVRVRILTNSLASTDVSMVHSGYVRYRKKLLKAGVELYELNRTLDYRQRKEKRAGAGGTAKASLHTKSFVVDGRIVFVGSLNMDPRSIDQNTEIGVVIENESLGALMRDEFEAQVRQGAFRLELYTREDGATAIRWVGYEDGREVTYDTEPHAGFWRRVGLGFFRMLPIESQL